MQRTASCCAAYHARSLNEPPCQVTDFCGKLTAEDVNEIMADADINNNGQLDYQEFLRLMTF